MKYGTMMGAGHTDVGASLKQLEPSPCLQN
jgi:hypothetical protein